VTDTPLAGTAGRPRYNSAATLDATMIAIPVPAAALAAVLERSGLRAHPMPGTPAGMHPLWIDVWRVLDARAELAGLDQHRWTELMGATTAAMAGAGWGMLWGAAAGLADAALGGARAVMRPDPVSAWWRAALGSMTGAVSGARVTRERWAQISGAAARRASERLSHTVGSYREVVVGVPNVTRAGQAGPRRMFVLCMFTDNPVAIWGDRFLGTGYRKWLASIRQAGDHLSVEAQGMGTALQIEVAPAPRSKRRQPDLSALPMFRRAIEQPFLGRRPDGRLVASLLERSFDDPARLLPPARADVTIGPALADGVPAGRYRVGPAARRSPLGLLRATGVRAQLRFPEPA
jgi:hypothetical protein